MRFFSGIQPTGSKHLGNYSGGFRQYVATQTLGEAFFCVVDLHSITVEYDPRELHDRTIDLVAMLLATGLDPFRSTIFIQSHVPAHAEAAWLLSASTSVGELRRMTQFKDKSASQAFVSAALLSYPVLMAGDILLYQAHKVPIGDDQRQHLELARNIAKRFNGRYGDMFPVPEGIVPQIGSRIMDLQDPSRKMSTTGGTELGTLGILDPPHAISKKIRSAETDSGREVRYDRAAKPGVSNLIEIMHVATGMTIEAIETDYVGRGYGALKRDLADALIACLEPVRSRYQLLRADEAELRRLLALGARKARKASAPTLQRLYDVMGFLRP